MLKSTTLYLIAFCVLAFGHCSESAATEVLTATTTEKEIERLIEAVAHSHCMFERNGQKHLSADAATHLHRKWKNAKNTIGNAEIFIENIASKSSTSGALYFIHCANKEPETSQQWLTRELANLRTQPK